MKIPHDGYCVLLNEVVIGTTRLKRCDPSMGVVSGVISFTAEDPFRLFFDHCQSRNIEINEADPSSGFIDTQVIPELTVVRSDGLEIRGLGNNVTGSSIEGYHVFILGIAHPFYDEEFPAESPLG